MTARATKAPPATNPESAAELRTYTAEELVDPDGDFRLPTTVGELKKLAYARRVGCTKVGGRIRFRLCHIRQIVQLYDVKPLSEIKPKQAA